MDINWNKKGTHVLTKRFHLGNYHQQKLDEIMELYEKDKYKACVILRDKPIEIRQQVLFTKENGNFDVALEIKRISAGRNNRMYISHNKWSILIYKDDKFYIKKGSNIRTVTYQQLCNDFTSEVRDLLKERFSWIRYIEEQKILENVAFNTIIKKKLYSYKKALQHTYEFLNYKNARVVHEHLKNNHVQYNKTIQKLKIYVNNLEYINPKFLDHNHDVFWDSLRMAEVLGKRINGKWSEKRLQAEHDAWTNEIIDITFEYSNAKLNIAYAFTHLCNHLGSLPGFRLIETEKELFAEGKKQKHCVGTYSSKINNGTCIIANYKGYTAEIQRVPNSKRFQLKQFRGFKNENAPAELKAELTNSLDIFNKIKDPNNRFTIEQPDYNGPLPF